MSVSCNSGDPADVLRLPGLIGKIVPSARPARGACRQHYARRRCRRRSWE